MTSAGPIPYAGNILDSPDTVWMDDEWAAEEEERALQVVSQKGPPVSAAWREKYEREARKSWDLFYRRNAGNFFKDRHYLGNVFPEVVETEADQELAKVLDADGVVSGRQGRRTLLELGCGVGNAVFPLLEDNRGLYVIAVDLSHRAIKLLKGHPAFSCGRCEAAVVDATRDDLPSSVFEEGGVDLVLLQFSLSAIAPGDMARVARLAESALKPGGKILLRDYGRHDEAQLRFASGRRLEKDFYVRQDGTTSYFFSLDDVRFLFGGQRPDSCNIKNFGGLGAQLVPEELSYIRRQYANRGQKVARRRVWVHGKFCKPATAAVGST